MTRKIHLPDRLTAESAIDLRQLNAELAAGAVVLDWSATHSATPEALEQLLGGLDLSEHADALGLDSISEAITDAVMLVFEDGGRRSRPRKAAGGKTAPAPAVGGTQSAAPVVWAAPRVEPAQPDLAPVADAAAVRPEENGATAGAAPKPVLVPPSPSVLRDELERLVLADLLGPAGGEEEELTDRPRDRYLVGMLAPRQQRVDQEVHDELAEGGVDTADDGSAEASAPPAPSMFPSSFGLTFCVDGSATELAVTASWGVYAREKSAGITTKAGDPATVWRRVPMGGSPRTVPLEAGKIREWSPDPELPEVHVRGVARAAGDTWIVTLWLVNDQTEPERLRDTAWLFQPELRVEAPDGRPIFRRRSHLRPGGGDLVTASEDRSLAMLYRRHLEFAVGHGVGVHADLAPGDSTGALRITTRVVPAYEVPPTTAGNEQDFPLLRGLSLDMAALAEVPDGGFGAALGRLIEAYGAWIDEQAGRLGSPDLADFADCAAEALAGCRRTLDRIRDGLDLLDRDPLAARAFRFANRAMWQQRVNTLVAAQARAGGLVDREAIDVPANRSWRLFQLAFILLYLPSLADLHHPDRSEGPDAGSDLLFFPTGGGKTEAYLGLTAYT
ncbi:MAG: helicase, partial [Chloroflexi bacterium]|nr:helicase [Chloroflexota bacterium]